MGQTVPCQVSKFTSQSTLDKIGFLPMRKSTREITLRSGPEKSSATVLVVLLSCLFVDLSVGAEPAKGNLVVLGGTVYTATGAVIQDGVVVNRKQNMLKTLQEAGGLHAQVEAVQSKVVSSFVGFEANDTGVTPQLLTVLEWQGNSDYDTLDEWIFEDIFLKATYSEDGFLDNA